MGEDEGFVVTSRAEIVWRCHAPHLMAWDASDRMLSLAAGVGVAALYTKPTPDKVKKVAKAIERPAEWLRDAWMTWYLWKPEWDE